MSTPRPSSCEVRRSSRWGAALRRGFTLIELLVVVAIIALLISILLPSLRAAREQTKSVVCGQRLKDFGNGLQVYVNNNEDWIPGINTSGVSVRAQRMVYPSNPGVLTKPDVPVQQYDWVTPCMSGATELAPDLAGRWRYILNTLRCPSQKYPAAVYAGPAPVQTGGPYSAISYLMSVHFQYVGQNYKDTVLGYWKAPSGIDTAIPVKAEAASLDWEVRVDDYLPNISRIGDTARKVFIADGSRFLDDRGDLDFDATPSDILFGSFTCSGGWWSGGSAYGVASGSANWNDQNVGVGSKTGGQNLGISYRHGSSGATAARDVHANKGRIEAAFFDGHVESMTDRKSREVYLWYPTGAVVQTPSEGLTYTPPGFVIP